MSQSVSVGATTAPEALSSLHQRLLVSEERAEALVRDMGSLGVSREHFPLPVESQTSFQRPMHGWSGQGDPGGQGTVWRQWDSLVSRVCHLESLLQTLKLATFRLETERELDPSHPARLKEQLAALQQENAKDQRASRREVMRVRDQARQACEERDEARSEVQRLSQALEMATATKMDTAVAAEELKIINEQMSAKLSEMEQQMIQDSAISFEAMKSHSELLQQLEDMQRVVEMERRQTQLVQADCQALRAEGQVSRRSLQEAQDKAGRLQEHCQWLREQTDVKELLVSELKSVRLALQKQQKENSKLLKDGAEWRAAEDKVQALNNQLERQCSELSCALCSLTVENAKQQTEHQASLKAERNRVIRSLQEHDVLLETARRNVQAELQGALSEKAGLQTELETLKADKAQLLQGPSVAQQTAATQRELLELTISRLRGELSAAQKEQGVLRKDLDGSQNELRVVVTKLEGEKSALERRLSEAKREAGCLRSALERQEGENRRLIGKMAAMEQQQAGVAEAWQDVPAPSGGASGQTSSTGQQVNTHQAQQQDHRGLQAQQQDHMGVHRHQSEVDKLQDLLSSARRNNSRALESLRKALDTARLDNRRLAQRLEQAVRTNASLQNKLEQTGHHTHRGEELREARTKISHLSEQLDSLQRQMTRDKEASRKTLHREISQLKRSLEDSSGRSGDVSTSNRELRKRVSELEKLVANQKACIRLQKSQLRQHLENRGTLDVGQNIKKPEESRGRLRRDEGAATGKPCDARMESQRITVDLKETTSCVQSESEGSKECWNRNSSGHQDPTEATPTNCKYDSQALGEGEPEWRRWTSIMERWEAKRELARTQLLLTQSSH